MVVPGKNLFNNNTAEGKKKIYLYGGLGLIGIILIVGIFFLIKYLVLAPEKEENITENDIDKILSSIKKDDHVGAESQAYGGITEPEKELKKNFENKEISGINKNSVINAKENKIEPSKPKTDVLDKKEAIQKSSQKEPEHKKEAVIKKEVENKKAAVEKKEPDYKKEVVAKVAPEPKKVEIKKEETSKNDSKDFKFTIQIASFKNPKSAEDDKKNLEKRKFVIDLKQVDLGDKGIWYRLRVGKYKSKDEAQNELWMIKSIGYNNAVITPY